MALRLAFMGTPDFAVPALKVLLASGHDVVAVYTQPPKPKGRGHHVQATPVGQVAAAAGVPVYTPKTLRDTAEQEKFAALKLDLAIVAAYGLILPKPILEAPRAGCVNLHASLLPRWRGAAPIARAIEAGDTASGICLMAMEEGLDTGGVFASTSVPITPTTTGALLHDALAEAGGALLREHLVGLAAGQLVCVPQPTEGITYAKKLDKTESLIDWSQDAAVIERRLRAFTPWPGLHFNCAGEAIKLLQAELVEATGPAGTLLDEQFTIACGTHALRLLKVQRPGRSPVDGPACLRGLNLPHGTRL
jgi:methionyl-tRNA formyltransferase